MKIVLSTILCIVSIIGLALSAHLNPFACSNINSITCVGSALGITAGSLGIIISIFVILTKKYTLFFTGILFLITGISFTSGVLWGIYSTNSGELYFSELGAITSIEFFISMFSIILAFYILLNKKEI